MEWDYRVAIVVVTLLAVATRFYKLGHPDEVVFDEVHFGKVGDTCLLRRQEYMIADKIYL